MQNGLRSRPQALPLPKPDMNKSCGKRGVGLFCGGWSSLGAAVPLGKTSLVVSLRERDRVGDADLSPAKTQNGWKMGLSLTVDNFVDAKASNFNKVQQASTSGPHLLQQESLRINKNP
jgi:hypothetical protein